MKRLTCGPMVVALVMACSGGADPNAGPAPGDASYEADRGEVADDVAPAADSARETGSTGCIGGTAIGSNAGLLYSFDFESGGLGELEAENDEGTAYGVTVVEDPLDRGNKAARFELRAKDPNDGSSQRVELKLHRSKWHADMGKEYWYGFRTLIRASDWAIGGDRWHVVAQWHDIPDGIDSGGAVEPWRSPVLALMVINGNWKITYRFDPDHTSKYDDTWDQRSLGGCAPYDWQGQIDKPPLGACWWQSPLGPDFGKWTNWVFHVKWAFDDQGALEVWKDGVKVISRIGAPIGYNDDQGPTSKFGMYRSSPYDREPYKGAYYDRVIFHDEYRIGGATASYDTVAPRCKR